MSEGARQIAVVRSMDDVEQLCRERIVELGITSKIMDLYTGFTEGYWGKLLAASPHSPSGKRGSKRGFSTASFEAALAGCCFDLVAVENPEKVAKLKAWMGKKIERRVGPKLVLTADTHRPITIKLSLRHMKKLSKLAAKARREKISKRDRSRLARNAAKARWHKPKVVEVTNPQLAAKLSALPTSEK